MATVAFGTGLALFALGGVLVAPAGRLLVLVGMVLSAVTALRTQGRVVLRGSLVGLIEAAVGVAGVYWWSQGHPIDVGIVTVMPLAIIALVLLYVAMTVRRVARR